MFTVAFVFCLNTYCKILVQLKTKVLIFFVFLQHKLILMREMVLVLSLIYIVGALEKKGVSAKVFIGFYLLVTVIKNCTCDTKKLSPAFLLFV